MLARTNYAKSLSCSCKSPLGSKGGVADTEFNLGINPLT